MTIKTAKLKPHQYKEEDGLYSMMTNLDSIGSCNFLLKLQVISKYLFEATYFFFSLSHGTYFYPSSSFYLRMETLLLDVRIREHFIYWLWRIKLLKALQVNSLLS
jgi:hypothetical protein